jgi:hypothetical protein
LEINHDALGGSAPAAWHPPYAIMPYYLYTIAGKFSVQIFPRHHMRPHPRWGQGWCKGGSQFLKEVFYWAEISGSLTAAGTLRKGPVTRTGIPCRLPLSHGPVRSMPVTRPRSILSRRT